VVESQRVAIKPQGYAIELQVCEVRLHASAVESQVSAAGHRALLAVSINARIDKNSLYQYAH